MVDFIRNTSDERMELIEEKLRNSFRAVKADNDEIKKKIEELANAAKNSTFSKDIADLNKKVTTNDDSFRKFKKDVSVDGLRREVVKEVLPMFSEKIKVGLQSITKENNEMRKDLKAFKDKWASSSEEKLNKGLEEMRANFKKLDATAKENQISNIKLFEKQNSRSKSEIKAIKKSSRREIDAQNKLIDLYSAKLEEYSGELDEDFRRNKKEILSSSERKFNALKLENDEELTRLRGQIAYIKGRVNKEIGVEEKPVVKVEKKVEKKAEVAHAGVPESAKGRSPAGQKKAKRSGPGFFGRIINLLSDEDDKSTKKEVVKPVFAKVEKKIEVKPITKEVKVLDKKNDAKTKNIFANLVSLLADESPEMKITVKKLGKKQKTITVKSVTHAGVSPAGQKSTTPVKQLGKVEENGFFNSIIKSLSD
ncbi:MAG: hypothetical protein WCI72_03850 [archaeon]